VSAIFSTEKGKIRADVSRQIKSEQDVQELLQNCSTGNFKVSDVVMKPAVKKPAAPFTTSTLQQEASIKLGFSVSRTMTVAQRLYEAGRITYMRTDSVNLSDTAIKAAEAEIKKAYGAEFSNPKKYKTKDSVAQEAHEAIRPSDFSRHNIQESVMKSACMI
jgi:DNA topoisomerase-1